MFMYFAFIDDFSLNVYKLVTSDGVEKWNDRLDNLNIL